MQGSEPRELGRETEGPVCETETASNACGSVSGSHPGRHSAGSVSLLLLFHNSNIHPYPGPGVVSIDLTAGGPAAELHTPSVGFRRGWLAEQLAPPAEQLAPPAGLCGLALTAADLAAGPLLPTPSEDYGSTPRAGGRAAEIHTPRASGLAAEILAPPDTTGHHRTDFRRGRLAEQLALPRVSVVSR
ncbi:hypothetical protein F7725_022297 [Dissostichus mawsoni]|uniref:Uncharacterized protein n=1 Tax=Dissostichus mawsoni TaxID=36200 RepID=A0A7J5YXC9_DISMA|nr:hypothetical protein F7725_022297 [Dissostichus mawsoni]